MFTSVDKAKHENISFSILDSRSIKHEALDQSVIKIKTPNQLNNSLPQVEPRTMEQPQQFHQILRHLPPRRHSVHPNSPNSNHQFGQYVSTNKVVVKRLGNTTISSTARNGIGLLPTSFKQNIPAVHQLMSNGNLVRVSTASPQTTNVANSTTAPQTSDSRDHIIAQLQEQNRELKKALIDIRKESSEVGYRMNRWASNITQMLNKFQTIPSPQQKPKVKITARKSTSPNVPPYNFREHSTPSPSSQSTATAVVPAKLRQHPVRILKSTPETKLVAYRSPVFPVKDSKILGLLECNLYQTQYFAHVKRNTFNTTQNIEIIKPTQMLDAVLKALIHDDLLNLFVLRDDNKPLADKTKALTWKCYPMVKELFGSVVNMLSMRKFNKKVDPQSIEQFLRNRILKNLNSPNTSVSATVTVTRTAPQLVQPSGITRISPPKNMIRDKAVIVRHFSPPKDVDRDSRSRSSEIMKSDDHSNGSNEKDNAAEVHNFRMMDEELNDDGDEYYGEDDDDEMFVLDADEN